MRLPEDVLALCRGPFCADDEEPWLLAPRDGHRRRFLGAVRRLGDLLEERQAWSAPHDLYTRAQDAEPLAEASYRGLMRCAHAQHDPTAAFSVYRRCRHILSVVLVRPPSSETEAPAVALASRSARTPDRPASRMATQSALQANVGSFPRRRESEGFLLPLSRVTAGKTPVGCRAQRDSGSGAASPYPSAGSQRKAAPQSAPNRSRSSNAAGNHRLLPGKPRARTFELALTASCSPIN